MAMMRQTQQQKLLQKLSPQQIQLMKLLQVPTANLEERIKEEMEENPALEYGDEKHEEEHNEEDPYTAEENGEDFEPDGSEEEYGNIDISEYIAEGDDDIADYRLRDENYSADQEEKRTIPIRVEDTFHDLLGDQLAMLNLDERQRKIAQQIIGSIDDDGYLRRDVEAIVDDLAFSQNISSNAAEISELIQRIQEFDPPGVCCADLQECLLLQLKRKPQDDVNVINARRVISEYFDEFTKKHYEKIQRGMGLDDEALKAAISEIIRLNPRPGSNYNQASKAESYIVPDFIIFNNNGVLELSLNAKNAPDLRISEGYREMLKDYDRGSKKDKRQKEAVLFIKQKIDAAKWFIDAIKQRQHTLLSTMETIMQYQEEFFLTGDDTTLKPMILKDIADRTGLDISTVSRVANSKYAQTEFGTYKLKYFFSESLSTESGEEVSTREVKKILTDLIEHENKRKPLSDESLTKLLQEKGYNIARRTVAKYREQLNISVARLRKEL
ncbi:RNA polymerase factor sigma-54 [Compostibacter hankyongensis]|uniref:RNA polymerase factor sigma-54 n=1 Tax=Compostibacter hankyongensis TaxID=1007089 RepID=A0ABP8FCY6_9BACT